MYGSSSGRTEQQCISFCIEIKMKRCFRHSSRSPRHIRSHLKPYSCAETKRHAECCFAGTASGCLQRRPRRNYTTASGTLDGFSVKEYLTSAEKMSVFKTNNIRYYEIRPVTRFFLLMMRPAGNCRALCFKIAVVNAMDMNKLIAEYEADLVPLRRRIEQLKLQESACHAVGEHLRA